MTEKVKLKKRDSTLAANPENKEKESIASPLGPSFGNEISAFAFDVESLSRANHQTMKVVENATKELVKGFNAFFKEKSIVTKTEDGETAYQIKPADFPLFKKRSKDLKASIQANMKIPQIFFCALIHQYDAFLGKLLKVAFYVKPESLNASHKQVSFSELMSFGSLDAAREYLIEKEIESIIRENHDEQVTCMENRFGLALRKDLPIWPMFIEMTERRNLYVHCDGIVSSQYLSVCQKHSFIHDNQLKAGQQLVVTKQYFDQAVDCILEIGVKLGHVLWRKLQPDKLNEADKSLHFTAYGLLLDEKYSLSRTLLQFAVNTLKKHSSESIRRMNLINLAISHYYLDNKPEALALLDSQDWSACEDKFKLAVAVLRDEYEIAEKLMQKIGKKGEVTREEYSSWPLFRTFRESKQFLRTYRKLFGKDFFIPKEEMQERSYGEESQEVVGSDS